MTTPRIAGPEEIAALLGVKAQTVRHWRRKTVDILPPPDWIISGVPIWREHRIVKWAKQTGRWRVRGSRDDGNQAAGARDDLSVVRPARRDTGRDGGRRRA